MTVAITRSDQRWPQSLVFVFAAGCAAAFAAFQPSQTLQLAVLGALVAIAGLPHGGLDPVVAARLGWMATPGRAAVFHLAYAGLAGLVILVWTIAPGASLIGFLLISAWHFGGDWRVTGHPAMRIAAGAALLALPAGADAAAVSSIYAFLVPDQGGAVAAVQAALAPASGLLIVALSAVSLARGRTSDAVELAALLVCGLFLPPLIFFAAYFCALHSPRHLADAWRRSGAPTTAKASIAIGYSLVSLAAAAAVWRWAPDLDLSALISQIVFIGLAALTVPHMALATLAERSERP